MEEAAKVSVCMDDKGAVIVGAGVLDLYTEEFGRALEAASSSADSVAVDFRDAIYIDTAILADLVSAAKRMLNRGKRLKVLLCEGSHPSRTIQMTGLSGIMDVVNEGEAVERV